MDIGNLRASDETAELILLHPVSGEKLLNEEKEEIKITLVGSDSSFYQRAEKEIANRRISNVQRQGRRAKITAESIEDDSILLLCRCTRGWTPFEYNGQVLSFSDSNAQKLYKEAPWIREQVDNFVHDRGNFLKN